MRFILAFLMILGLYGYAEESYRVVGVGSCVVDLLVKVEDQFIADHGQVKGAGILCDGMTFDRVVEDTGAAPKIVFGGSVANTIRALSRLGEKCGFYGVAGNDAWGDLLCRDFRDRGVVDRVVRSSKYSTVRVLVMISPDGQRTFLGSDAPVLDILPSKEVFKGTKWAHVEARRLIDGESVETVMRLGKEAGATVSFDISSSEYVHIYKERMERLISQYVDVIFCNEDEARALSGLDNLQEGCLKLQTLCPMAVVTLGSKGCYVASKGVVIHVPGLPADVIDTTGAGDLFTAGFIYGQLNHYPLETCAKIGHRLGSAIVEVIGASLPEERWNAILAYVDELKKEHGVLARKEN